MYKRDLALICYINQPTNQPSDKFSKNIFRDSYFIFFESSGTIYMNILKYIYIYIYIYIEREREREIGLFDLLGFMA